MHAYRLFKVTNVSNYRFLSLCIYLKNIKWTNSDSISNHLKSANYMRCDIYELYRRNSRDTGGAGEGGEC